MPMATRPAARDRCASTADGSSVRLPVMMNIFGGQFVHNFSRRRLAHAQRTRPPGTRGDAGLLQLPDERTLVVLNHPGGVKNHLIKKTRNVFIRQDFLAGKQIEGCSLRRFLIMPQIGFLLVLACPCQVSRTRRNPCHHT